MKRYVEMRPCPKCGHMMTTRYDASNDEMVRRCPCGFQTRELPKDADAARTPTAGGDE